MMPVRVVCFVFVLALFQSAIGQKRGLLDFDSLYANNPSFRTAFDSSIPEDGFFSDDAPLIEMKLASDFKEQ